MNDDLILTELDASGYAVLTLNRPASLNALSRELIATVRRDGSTWEQKYKQGAPVGGVKKLGAARGTAGLRPGFSDQYETYSLNNGLISKDQLGNPLLEPAIQTEKP